MKQMTVWALLMVAAVPAMASTLFSGTDSVDYDVIAVRPFSIQGTGAHVLLIQSRYVKSGDYVVMLRSMEPDTKRELIAEVRFREGEEEMEPYAVWLDSCFARGGTLCNENPPLRQQWTLGRLIEKIEDVYRNRPLAAQRD